MKWLKIFLFISSLSLIQCAKTKQGVLSTEKLDIYVTAQRLSTTTASCYVDFQDPQNSYTYYHLEPEDLVTCDGVVTTPNSNGWSATFSHPSTGPVRVDIIRPSAGSTVVRYTNPI